MKVIFGHHVVLSMKQEQAFWWPWTTVPHICLPSPERFREALKSMVGRHQSVTYQYWEFPVSGIFHCFGGIGTGIGKNWYR